MELEYRHRQGKVVRLEAICLPAVDLEASVDWYCGELGFEALRRDGGKAELAIKENGAVVYPTLTLVRSAANERLVCMKDGRPHAAVMLHASNLEGLRRRMVESGAVVSLPHAGEDGGGCGTFFEAVDPSGNVVQIQANEGETPAERVRAEAVFNLEMPVADVRRSARFYTDALGFTPVREPDDELAIVKTGPYYRTRFGYEDVQEFGFFLFRHGGSATRLEFRDAAGRTTECLVLSADDLEAMHGMLTRAGLDVERLRDEDGKLRSIFVPDPDGNRIRIVPHRPEADEPSGASIGNSAVRSGIR